MKAYKGFSKDMKCRDFQYEEGKEYETDVADVCRSGFHACEAPLDCFDYYEPGTSVYHEVEVGGDIDRANDDSKVAATKIKIGARVSVAEIFKAQFDYVKERVNKSVEAGDSEAVSGGDKSAVSGGYKSAVSGGYRSAVSGGDGSAVSGGDESAVSGGYGSAVSGGYGSAVSGGDGSAVSGGYKSAVSGGYGSAVSGGDGSAVSGGYKSAVSGGYGSAVSGGYGSAVSGGDGSAVSGRGTTETGKQGVCVCKSETPKARGKIGAVIVLAQESNGNYDIVDWRAFQIDGETYKPDVWYTLKNGEVVETDA